MHSQSYATFFHHSAVLKVPAVLLRELPIIFSWRLEASVRYHVMYCRHLRKQVLSSLLTWNALVALLLLSLFVLGFTLKRFACSGPDPGIFDKGVQTQNNADVRPRHDFKSSWSYVTDSQSGGLSWARRPSFQRGGSTAKIGYWSF